MIPMDDDVSRAACQFCPLTFAKVDVWNDHLLAAHRRYPHSLDATGSVIYAPVQGASRPGLGPSSEAQRDDTRGGFHLPDANTPRPQLIEWCQRVLGLPISADVDHMPPAYLVLNNSWNEESTPTRRPSTALPAAGKGDQDDVVRQGGPSHARGRSRSPRRVEHDRHPCGPTIGTPTPVPHG